MLSLELLDAFAVSVNAEQVLQMTGVETGCDGTQYPVGGWLCPTQSTVAVFNYAATLGLRTRYQHTLVSLSRQAEHWQLTFTGGGAVTYAVVVLASGHHISGVEQTQSLPVYSVDGQVSHIPTTPSLSALRQVSCYDGYLVPYNPQNQQHCTGASYHRGSEETAYRVDDQQRNRQCLIDCFPNASWAKEVDVSGNAARCEARCVARDHMPVVGNVADYDTTLGQYATFAEDRVCAVNAPVYSSLFMLGALGSCRLCTASLRAETPASQMSNESMPMDVNTLAALNPNRLWVRKLLKDKTVE